MIVSTSSTIRMGRWWLNYRTGPVVPCHGPGAAGSSDTPLGQTSDMAWTYMLRCDDGTLYVGSTRALDHRLSQHHLGCGSKYTASRRPLELVWRQEFEHIVEAWRLERQIHGWGRAKREAFIDGGFEAVQALGAQTRSASPQEPPEE